MLPLATSLRRKRLRLRAVPVTALRLECDKLFLSDATLRESAPVIKRGGEALDSEIIKGVRDRIVRF